MNDQEKRLAIAEMKLEEHGRLHEETSAAIRELTNAITKLVQAEIRREQDTATFNRIFDEIKKSHEEIVSVKNDFEDYKDKQVEKELAAYRGIVWKVAGLVTMIAVSAIAGAMGVHLIA